MRLSADSFKCTGCCVCQNVCSFVNTGEINLTKSFLKLKRKHIMDEVIVCTQCGICAKKCEKKAIIKKGDVYKISDKCDGCRECISSCPFGLIIIHGGKAVKCEGCGTCIEWCPVKAISKKVDKK